MPEILSEKRLCVTSDELFAELLDGVARELKSGALAEDAEKAKQLEEFQKNRGDAFSGSIDLFGHGRCLKTLCQRDSRHFVHCELSGELNVKRKSRPRPTENPGVPTHAFRREIRQMVSPSKDSLRKIT
jgi:hypothetical protein